MNLIDSRTAVALAHCIIEVGLRGANIILAIILELRLRLIAPPGRRLSRLNFDLPGWLSNFLHSRPPPDLWLLGSDKLWPRDLRLSELIVAEAKHIVSVLWQPQFHIAKWFVWFGLASHLEIWLGKLVGRHLVLHLIQREVPCHDSRPSLLLLPLLSSIILHWVHLHSSTIHKPGRLSLVSKGSDLLFQFINWRTGVCSFGLVSLLQELAFRLSFDLRLVVWDVVVFKAYHLFHDEVGWSSLLPEVIDCVCLKTLNEVRIDHIDVEKVVVG